MENQWEDLTEPQCNEISKIITKLEWLFNGKLGTCRKDPVDKK